MLDGGRCRQAVHRPALVLGELDHNVNTARWTCGTDNEIQHALAHAVTPALVAICCRVRLDSPLAASRSDRNTVTLILRLRRPVRPADLRNPSRGLDVSDILLPCHVGGVEFTDPSNGEAPPGVGELTLPMSCS